ncbi:MAG: BadF/BadG/BcrA/BcrD ATPase family protein [Candidatus Coatesbacteria bacterium]
MRGARGARTGVILGVDGGNSKTDAVIANALGRVVAIASTGGSNHENLGLRKCVRVLDRLVTDACRKAKVSRRDIRGACFGLAGVDIPADFPLVERQVIAKLGLRCPTKLHNDAFLPLFNDQYRSRGVGVTGGAGRKWVGVNGNRLWMIEGYGLPDLRMVLEAELLRAAEGVKVPDGFDRRLLRYLGYRSFRQYVEEQFFRTGRPYVKNSVPDYWTRRFHLPKWFAGELRRGGATARAALREYGGYVAAGVEGVLRNTGLLRAKVDVVLSGSVLANVKPVRDEVVRRLAKTAPRARVIGAKYKPVRGALAYAAQLAWGGLPDGALREPWLLYRP